MKQLNGLDVLVQNCTGRLTTDAVADLLLTDLQHGKCYIYGQSEDETVLLAELVLAHESLSYEMFDQRIDLILSGKVIRGDFVPLTYRLQGNRLAIIGRCSMLPKVCGVDWYLGSGYSGKAGEQARLKYHIAVKDLMKKVRTSG